MAWDQWSQLSQTVEQFTAAVGILGGAVWAYFKFLRGRTFAYRAQLSVADVLIGTGPFPNVRLRVALVNCGLSKVPFSKGLKVARLFAVTEDKWRAGRNIKWGDPLILTPIFENHAWIEAGETITESVLMPVSGVTSEACLAYRVTVEVFAAPRRERGPNVTWFAEEIILPERVGVLRGPAVTAPAESPKPTEPSEPREPAEPAEPAEPTEPTEPTERTNHDVAR